MRLLPALAGGIAGSVVITLVHELLKNTDPEAPRMDKLGMEAIARGLEETDQPVPSSGKLFQMALIGDLLSNALYYSLTGLGKRKNATSKGNMLGIAAGMGAILLPKPLGLSQRHSNKTFRTQVMTMGLYMLGGYIASQVTKMLDKEAEKNELEDLATE